MTNRQEVAKKLREGSVARTTNEVYVVLLSSIGITHDYTTMFDRLADLIDPTCTPEEDGYNIVCSQCGADLYDDDLYCSRCGSRVVRRNDKV